MSSKRKIEEFVKNSNLFFPQAMAEKEAIRIANEICGHLEKDGKGTLYIEYGEGYARIFNYKRPETVASVTYERNGKYAALEWDSKEGVGKSSTTNYKGFEDGIILLDNAFKLDE